MDALFFGPHPDDVELTCGGLAARLALAGHAVAVVDMTRGELGTRGDVAARAAEAERAARELGVARRLQLALPDGGLHRHDPDQLRVVVECLRQHRPSLVVAPDAEDSHPDHVEGSHLVARAVYLSGLARYPAAGERHRPARVLYSLHRSAARPHLVVDISAVWARREAALRAHTSQLDPAAGPATYLTAPGFLAEVEARARHFGALIGVVHGEGYRCRGPVAVTDPRSLLAQPEQEAR